MRYFVVFLGFADECERQKAQTLLTFQRLISVLSDRDGLEAKRVNCVMSS